MNEKLKFLEFFEENQDKISVLEKYVGLATLIHVSPERRTPILQQIERARNKIGAVTKAWDKYEQRNKGKPESDALFDTICLAINEPKYLDRVIQLMIHFISIPQLRLFTQPLLEETNFLNSIPIDHPFLSLFDYYLSYQYKFDIGVLTFQEATKEYNNFIIKFQNEINNFDRNSPLATATLNELQSDSYIFDVLFESSPDFVNYILKILNIIPSQNLEQNLYSISRALQPPQDPREKIPFHILPTRKPPNILYPNFSKYALSMMDASFQVFLQKRYQFAIDVLSLLEDVFKSIHPDNEVRFHPYAVPLKVPAIQKSNTKQNGIIISLALDPTFLQWDVQGFKEGEIVYLLNVVDTVADGNNIQCIGCIVTECLANHTILVKVDADSSPSKDFNVVVKLPININRDGQRLIELSKCINIENIPKKVLDSYIGFKNSQGPGISLFESPIGTTGLYHAAKWLAENYKYGEKTLVVYQNTEMIDEFLKTMKKFEKTPIPSFHYMRFDVTPEISFQVAMKTRDQILQTLIDGGIDPAWCQSCLVALNYLRMDNQIDKALIDCLEQLRPLEFLGSIDKSIDYLKRNVAQIIFQLNTQDLMVKNTKITNLIILDNFLVEDADFIKFLTNTKPNNVMFYGQSIPVDFCNSYSLKPAFMRMWESSETFTKNNIKEIQMKSDKISEYISSFYSDVSVDNTLVTPFIVNPMHYFTCQSDKESNEVTLASAFMLRMANLDSDNILIVVPNEIHQKKLLKKMRKRASWNPKLLMMKDKVVTFSEFIHKNLKAFAICATVNDLQYFDTISQLFADRANGVVLLSGPALENAKIEQDCLKIAFDEKFGVCPGEQRQFFEVNSADMFLQLVLHMQQQII